MCVCCIIPQKCYIVNSKFRFFFTNMEQYKVMEILFWGHGPGRKNEKIALHKHGFTQIEIMLNGRRRCKNAEDDIQLTAGEIIVVPMNVEHCFFEHSSDLEYLSFKIQSDEEYSMPSRLFKVSNDLFVHWVINNFREIIRNHKYSVSPASFEIMHVLLSALMEHLKVNNQLRPEPPLLHEIRQNIARYGARCNVNVLAEELGMNVYKFRRKFRKAMLELAPGARFSSPQQFIKNELLSSAIKHLCGSDVSIGELSDMLHFNNVYTFSRFFKNNTGLAPGAYRKKHSLPVDA